MGTLDVATFPVRPADETWMEGFISIGLDKFDHYRHCDAVS
jgi:hypothetical protein